MAPSVKDAIEAHGVPHTEVGLVLVGGVPVGFEHRLNDGDRVGVFPAFRTLDVAAVTKVAPDPMGEDVRFVADGHLGALARFLRLLGFDTRYDPDAGDDALVEASRTERRVVLTRDRGVLKRRAVRWGMFVRSDDPEEQLVDVVRAFRLSGSLRPFTRCMACNGALVDVDKSTVADRLEPGTRAAFERFRRCDACGRVYWEGSHHARLVALVERVRRRAAGRGDAGA